MKQSQLYYTESPAGVPQMWLPSRLLDDRLRNQVKELIEVDYKMRPAWFFTGTYWETKGAREDISIARSKWDMAMVCLSHNTNQHLAAISAFGFTKRGHYHNHGTILGERGKLKRITQKKIRKAYRGGISDMRLYNPNKGGVPYALAHEHIAPMHKVFCPKGGCERCESLQRDYIGEVLRANTRSVGDGVSLFDAEDVRRWLRGEG